MWRKIIGLPKVNIKPEWTIEGQILKMVEEIGEVSQAVVKKGDLREAGKETIDVAQTAVTLLAMLEKQGVDIDQCLMEHITKLHYKGYVTDKRIPVVTGIERVDDR